MISAKNIAKSFGKNEILEDISISATKGEIVAIVGKNGCGKSTFLSILSGIDKPDSGELSILGGNPFRDRRLFTENIGYIPQTNPLIEDALVKDNLKLWNTKCILSDKIIDSFNFEDILTTRVSKLSGGMKRRLSLACVLQNRPPILVLDEPTASLDLYYKELIHNNLREYCSAGGVVIMSTHDEAEIEFCNKVYYLENGYSLEIGGSGEKRMTEIMNRLLKS